MNSIDGVQRIKVWDAFVRLFHWGLVACVLSNYFIVDDGETLHQWLGYTASALVAARVVWGFIGTRYARFAEFFPTPRRLREHFQAMRSGHPQHDIGHNPAGALMMLTLMALVVALGVSGYLQGTDAFWGEEWLQALHEILASTLIALAGLHVLAAIVMSRLSGINLIAAMITGIKVLRKP